ncbi:MAG TPA: redox-regulated ATPase YchF [Thermoanaerobaculia bacterium]|nr:redox-regulated ATPase YchF [Thermoanaerobaculia bacterium]
METGILGLHKSGKTTLFNILTAARQATDKFARSGETHVGVASVPDPRLEKLRDLFQPKKFTPATVRYVDIPGIEKSEGGEAAVDLDKLKAVDALMLVVRAFDDPELPHPEGSIDPARDVATVELELVLADHGLVERRIDRLEKARKRGLSPEEERERKLLVETILPALEAERPLRTVALDPDDERRLRGFQLLSAKPLLVVLNVGEDEVATADPAALGIEAGEARQAIVVSAPIEEEISRLDPDEQQELLADLGLAEPPAARVLRATLDLLGRIAFFTVGEDEVRAWTVRRGTAARQAGGAIHSDIERGFIRAEVVRWDDLLRLGSLAACREEGVLRLEGKEYAVEDGDVIHFRFNV